MFEDVLTALRDRVAPADRAVVLELLDVVDLASVVLNDALDVFDEARLWDVDHAPSLVAWLTIEGRRTPGDASRLHRRMLRMRSMCHVREAWRDLRFSTGHVDVIVANVTDRTVRLFEAAEADFVVLLSQLTVEQATGVMRRWAAEAKESLRPDPANPDAAPDAGPDAGEEPSTVHASRTLDGRMALNGDLGAEDAESVQSALSLADDGDLSAAPAQRRAAALGRVCRFFLNNHEAADLAKPRPGQRRARAQIHVIVSPDGRSEDEAGIPLPPSMVERLMCDAKVNDVRFADGQILYYGKDKRTAPDHLYDALVVRDRGCRFASCGRPAFWCDAHHVVPWDPNTTDGPTDIDNMVLLCDAHHHKVHRRGWSAKLLADGVFEVTDPTGKVHRSDPPGDFGGRPRLPI